MFVFYKKKILRKKSKIRFLQVFCIISKIIFVKFQNDCSKNEGGDRFLEKWSKIAVLVYPSHKEPIERSNFDRLYLKSYFEF